MRILFDQGTPVPLRHLLPGHEIATAYESGWAKLTNGQLLQAAESAGFDLLLTTDRNLRYQQNLGGRRIAVLVLSTTSWPRIRAAADAVAQALPTLAAGGYAEVTIP